MQPDQLVTIASAAMSESDKASEAAVIAVVTAIADELDARMEAMRDLTIDQRSGYALAAEDVRAMGAGTNHEPSDDNPFARGGLLSELAVSSVTTPPAQEPGRPDPNEVEMTSIRERGDKPELPPVDNTWLKMEAVRKQRRKGRPDA